MTSLSTPEPELWECKRIEPNTRRQKLLRIADSQRARLLRLAVGVSSPLLRPVRD